MLDAISSYNFIMGKLSLKLLGVALSTLYLSMKYLHLVQRVGVIQGDQGISQEFYECSIKIRKV